MSVDTNTVGKNLAPYTTVRHLDFTIAVSPVLVGLVSSMRIVTSGRFLKHLVVEMERHDPDGADTGPDC